MDLATTRFGVVPVDEERILHMDRGLIGFADQRRYVILQPRPGSALYWYQSVDRADLAFVITIPQLFVADYRLTFTESVLSALKAEGPGDLDVYVLVTIPKGRPEEMTANLMGPLVINQKARLAEQLIIEDARYSHKQPLFERSGK